MPCLPYDIFLQVLGLGLLPHKENEALDLTVAVFGSTVFFCETLLTKVSVSFGILSAFVRNGMILADTR